MRLAITCLFIQLTILVHAQVSKASYTITLKQTERLELQGTSNAVDFTCGYPARRNTAPLSFVWSEGWFHPAPVISLKVRQLDCGGAGINNDMRKTLQEESYPEILLQPTYCGQLPVHLSRSSSELLLVAYITLAGTRKKEQIYVHIQHTGQGNYRISGSHRLYFSHYGLKPPSAMFGLIQVNDAIDLYFDFLLQVTETP